MRLPRVRFTVMRKMVAAAAISALTLATAAISIQVRAVATPNIERRAAYCRERANFFADYAADRRWAASNPYPLADGRELTDGQRFQLAYVKQEALRSDSISRRWALAASRPERPIPVDLPTWPYWVCTLGMTREQLDRFTGGPPPK